MKVGYVKSKAMNKSGHTREVDECSAAHWPAPARPPHAYTASDSPQTAHQEIRSVLRRQAKSMYGKRCGYRESSRSQ
jgi:hypothetical protein